ncbi:MAG: hypothetical protein Q7L55_02055 [Actinomycetota bacterium]|nr:hypothetical protein [Actinomycetota bacterium]
MSKLTGRTRVRISALVLLASATMLLAPLSAPANAATNVTPDQFSLGLAPEVTTAPGVAAGYIRLWDMGVAWRDVNPAPGVFQWTVLDQRIAQAQAAGAKVLYVAGLTPVWAAANPADGDPRWGLGSASAPADPATYGNFITALMQRYSGRIAAIETWNEANLKTFWTGTPEQMADLTQRANSAIKAISPGTTVFAASTTTRLINSVKTFFGPYAAALKAKGYPIDGWTIHTYPAANATPVNRFDAIDAWRGVLSDSTGADPAALSKAVWDTEINYGLAGPGAIPDQDFDGPTGAMYLARTYVDSMRQGISATFWYLWTAGPYGLIGVQMYDGTTQTIDAYNRVRKWTAGATLNGCDVAGDVVRCFFVGVEPFIIAMSKSGSPAAWNGSPTLGAQKWDGTGVLPVGTLSLDIGPVRLLCGADKSLCTQAGVAGAGGTAGVATGPVSDSITITSKGSVYVRGHKRFQASGTAPSLAGQQLIPCFTTTVVKSGKSFTNCLKGWLATSLVPPVSAAGAFTFTNLTKLVSKPGTKISVVLQSTSGSVKSNPITLPRR